MKKIDLFTKKIEKINKNSNIEIKTKFSISLESHRILSSFDLVEKGFFEKKPEKCREFIKIYENRLKELITLEENNEVFLEKIKATNSEIFSFINKNGLRNTTEENNEANNKTLIEQIEKSENIRDKQTIFIYKCFKKK